MIVRRPRRVAAVAAGLCLVLAGQAGVAQGAPSAARPYVHGAAGVGDPYFPLEGNGGYNVSHYTLDLHYLPSARRLSGTAHITARATENLSRFDLDLSGMHVHRVTVNSRRATWHRHGQELQITPRHGLARGHKFHVAVTYHGTPRTIVGSPIVFGSPYGWQYTKDGAFVGDEPNAAHTWFPSNDHPSDKATYTFHVTVPRGRQVVANGNLVRHRTTHSSSSWTWHETSPMATYLATIDIGKWKFRFGHTPSGIREALAYDPALAKKIGKQRTFAQTGAITDYWAKKFGRYPFSSTGAIVDNVPDVGFSLETQTRPLYGFVPDPITMSHELSHEWFGDSVSVATWRDIWLNEGFATFAERLWEEHLGHGSTYSYFRTLYGKVPASDSFWHQSMADPKRDTMFSTAVYYRGGMTLAALRHRIGDATFFRLLQTWAARHRHGNADTAQFVALAQQVSGQNLTAFFRVWLWNKSKPTSFGAG